MTTLYAVARGRKRKLREKVHSEGGNEKASEEGRMNREGQADGPVSLLITLLITYDMNYKIERLPRI